jgi:uncharacterized protein YgiM (DUF1202 family)
MDKKWKAFFVVWPISIVANIALNSGTAGLTLPLKPGEKTVVATCADTRVRLRDQPTLDSNTLGYLDLDDRLKVEAKSDNAAQIGDLSDRFYKVARDRDGLTGWAFGGYLIFKNISWLSPGWPRLGGLGLRTIDEIPGDVLNIRSAPNSDSEIIGSIPPSKSGIIYKGKRDGNGDSVWLRIEFEGKQGWISSRYVEREQGQVKK